MILHSLTSPDYAILFPVYVSNDALGNISIVGDNYIDEFIQSYREIILMINIARIPISVALEFAETARQDYAIIISKWAWSLGVTPC